MSRHLGLFALVCVGGVGCGFASFQGEISVASHRANLRTVGAFSPDGTRFAVVEARLSGARAETTILRIYRRGPTPDLPSQWRLVTRVKLGDLFAVDAAFSPDGRTLAVAGLAHPHSVALWDVAAGRIRRVLTGNAPLTQTLAFSPDGESLVTGGLDGAIRIYGVRDGALRATVREDPALLKQSRFPLVVSQDGRWIAYGRLDGRVGFADLATGAPLRIAETGAGVIFDLARSANGRWLAAASDGGLLLWDLSAAGGVAQRLATASPTALAFAPDNGSLLLSGAKDGQAQVITIPSGQVLYGYAETPRAQGRLTADGREARVWSRLRRTFPAGPTDTALRSLVRDYVRSPQVHRVAFSPEDLWIAFFEGRHAGLVITKRHYELRRIAKPPPRPGAATPAPAPASRAKGSI